ncbi:hypothetical protein [Phaeodactylibacter xiamenensis]|nr:hypothetical protein [Phaeodactylibacter xiamenensis]
MHIRAQDGMMAGIRPTVWAIVATRLSLLQHSGTTARHYSVSPGDL